MINLIQEDSNEYFERESWIVTFFDHLPLSFKTKDDMEKYLNRECSEAHGYMEYERIPSGVRHEEYYRIEH